MQTSVKTAGGPKTGRSRGSRTGGAPAKVPGARVAAEAAPVLILASRESGGSLVAALLGAHPGFEDAPQINLLAFEEVWQLVRYGQIPRDTALHGLLRYLAFRLTGEETIQAVQTAQRWLARRAERTAAAVHAELRAMAAPRRFVDYSPLVAQNGAAMRRALAALPESAVVVHVTRDPLSHGRAMSLPVWQSVMTSLDFWDRRGLYQAAMDVFEIGEHYIDWSSRPPVFDPQFAWHRTQRAALDLRDELPPERWIHVDSGALGRDPDGVIGDLLTRLGAAADAATIAAMRGAEMSRHVRPGPYSTPFGMDFEMMDIAAATALAAAGRQAARTGAGGSGGAETPLPWRGDGGTLLPEVVALAARLGYARAEGGELANEGRMVFSPHHEDTPAVMGPAS